MKNIDELIKWNCSTIFLLNPLGLERLKLLKIGFREAYLNDEFNQVKYKNPVFLLFRPENIDRFQIFVENEYSRINNNTGTKDLVADYDRGNGEIVLVYEFPYKEDYKKFLRGKYSEFSQEIRNSYPKTIKVRNGDNDITILGFPYRIITKDRESQELIENAYSEELAPLVTQSLVPISSMLEEKYDITFTDDMELWTLPSIEKETLKYE